MIPSGNKSVTIIGHPLAAEENRLAFNSWNILTPNLITPRTWPSRSLGVTYAAPAPGGEGAVSLPCRLAGRNSLFTWRGLSSALRNRPSSILYCWEEPWCLSTLQIARYSIRNKIPFVFYSAENRPKTLPFPFGLIMRSVFRHARACVVPSASIAENVRCMGFAGEVLQIPLWIRPGTSLQPDYPRRTLVFVGRLIPLKRVDLLIRSLLTLPGFHLRIIGDGPERPALERLAANLKLSDRVDFLGHVPNADLENALAGAGCVVLPTAATESQAEQFGKVVLESIRCGLPALVSNSGALPGWAERFPSVRRITAWTPEAVTVAVNGLWAHPPTAAILADARVEVERNYGAEAVGRKMEKAFADLLGAKP